MSSGSGSRYDLIVRLASGGMATVWIGSVRGALGFRQLVAIKKPHPYLVEDTAYRKVLVAEARLASLIRHANVVDVRDVEVDGEAISLVMDYIEGASLAELVRAASERGQPLPARVAVRIALDALAGMHAAHELVDERGRHVGLVHRDISPQNILVGVDGLARVADFGVAKYARKTETTDGSLKGKLAYMAPEYLRGEPIDRRFDVYALGIVLWEALAGKRLFRGANEAETVRLVLDHQPELLATVAPAATALDDVLSTALARPVEERFQTAQAMATALERRALAAGLLGSQTEVAAALEELVGASIEERRALVREKLANEPSLGSMMGESAPAGAPPIALPPTALPPTALPPTALPPTVDEAAATMAAPPTPIQATARLPAHAPQATSPSAAPRAARTMLSAGTEPPARAAAGTTLLSAAPGDDTRARRRARSGDTQISAADAAPVVDQAMTSPGATTAASAPPRGRLIAVLAVAVGSALALAAIAFGVTRAQSASDAPAAGGPARTALRPAGAVPAKGNPTASASTAPAATLPATPTASTAAPTTKKPTPNPHANE